MRASRFSCLVAAGLIAFGVTSVQAATIELVPVRASGVQGVDWDLGPGANEITLSAGGQSVEVYVRISGFAPQDVATYQSTIDCSTLVQGEFEAIQSVCPADGNFGDIFCMGVDESQPDYILAAASGTLPACQSTSLCTGAPDFPGAFACGSVLLFGSGGADDGSSFYGSQFAYDVTSAARGSYTVGLDSDPNNTLIRDGMAREVPIDNVINATITIPVGACCGVTAGNGLGCADDQTEGECAAAGGGWFPGDSCSGEDTTPADGLDDFCPICDTDADCDDGNSCTADTCEPSGCVNTDTTPAGQCCNPNGGALTQIDDGDPCTDDICNADGSVSHPAAAAGTACDDGNGCTASDECDGAGGCAGVDINSIACGDVSECPAGAQSCDEGFCVCTLETKMDIEIADGNLIDPNCFLEGESVTASVVMGAGSECVTGGQFLVTYDPSCLDFDSLSAGAFFPLLIFSDVDEAAGTIFAAVGVMPGGGCTQGPEVLATLNFTKLGDCDSCSLGYDNINPQNTILTNDAGNSVPLTFNDSKEISLAGALELDGPEGLISVNPDCDTAVATVTWDSLSVSTVCDDPADVSIDCEAFHDGGVDIDHLAANGGTFPQGRSSFSCTATNPCGFTDTVEWTVEVSDQHALDVEVQLSPVIVGDPLTRCICFDFYSDCVQAPTNFCQDLVFGFPYDFTGKSTASLKVPKGQYACITAKDPLHSLRSVSDIDCVGNTLVAEFKGDPEFDGNWLVNGNLDCWKADGNGDTIDILDFGMFVSQYLADLDPNTPCGTDGPHSDINGDGVVDGADFTFISMNFLETSKNSCCDDGTAATAEEPIVSITVKELRMRGLGELIVADINGDHVLDQSDMAAFMAGQSTTPNRTIKRGTSSGRGSLGR